MLFSYPPVGFEDNWLHETLVEMLLADMESIDDGHAAATWPDCIPQLRQEELKSLRGLRDRRTAYLDAYSEISIADRETVRGAMARQNAFPAIFDDDLPCATLAQLPESIREPTKSLFEFAFGLLPKLGLRDQNYDRLYGQLKYKVCAFCGIEMLDAPGQKREALDHYIPVAIYPFAGVNFRNLSPMGSKCNSRYKGKQDIIADPETGARRRCCDPYASPELTLSLNDSRPFEGDVVDLIVCPDWGFQWLNGDAQKVDTWRSVFNIEERYRKSSLNQNFRSWIDHFCSWAASLPDEFETPANLRSALERFADIVVPEGIADSAFLKRATIQMLAHKCDDTDNGLRIFEWLRFPIAERRQAAG